MAAKAKNTPKQQPEEPKGYNGWKNYETWCVALWIDNEEPLYRERRRMMRQVWREAEDHAESGSAFTASELARGALSDSIKGWVSDMAPDLGGTLWADLLSAAISEVDWFEIADNWLTEVDGYEARK